MLSWKIFTHYLLSRRSGALIRTVAWMSMVGIMIGVAALIVVVGVMNGFNQVIRDRHLRAEPHLVVHAPSGVKEEVWIQHSEKKIREILADELTGVTGFASQDVILKTVDGFFAGAVAKGLASQAIKDLAERLKRHPERGDSVTLHDGGSQEIEVDPWELTEDEVVIGSELGEGLQLVAGDKLVLIAPEVLLLPADEAPPMKTVTVKDFFYSQLQDVDGKLLIYDRENSLKALKNTASKELGVEIRLKNGDAYEEAAQKLKAAQFTVETWPERNSAMFFALKMEKLSMTIFLGLSALITSFSILTVLILLVTQKRKEIGILMAMGLNARRTRQVFAMVGVWLSSLGVGAGVILGVSICWVLDRFPMNLLPSIYYDRTIPAQVNGTMIVVILSVAAVIAVVGSWFPAHMSTRSNSAEALRGTSN
ncbi:MAG: FtsX-like permease family protein [Bdellovibrionales bacterium]